MPDVLEAQKQFKIAMDRYERNKENHKCKSCGQTLDKTVIDCCQPPELIQTKEKE